MVGNGKGTAGSGRSVIEVLTHHLPEGTEENHEKTWITGVLASNRTLSE
jgi:hypothetical protein